MVSTVYITGRKGRARAHVEFAHVRARVSEYEPDVDEEPDRCGYTRDDQ